MWVYDAKIKCLRRNRRIEVLATADRHTKINRPIFKIGQPMTKSFEILVVDTSEVSKSIRKNWKLIGLSNPKFEDFEYFGAKNKNFSNFLNISPRVLKFTV